MKQGKYLKFGKSKIPVPGSLFGKAQWLFPRSEPAYLKDVEAAVATALKSPIGSDPLFEMIQKGDRVAIIVSDTTRPIPSYQILPAILNEIHACGVEKKNVVIVCALGIHRKMTEKEIEIAIGENIVIQYKVVQPTNYVALGMTSRGTPVEVCSEVASSDVIILTGNIEYHYFAGYSGGFKALMPGVSSKNAIQNNHKLMLEPSSITGVSDGNPVREDIEEYGRWFPRVFLINVLLNTEKRITHVIAGDPILAHRSGCVVLDKYYKIYVTKPADLVVVSAGGYPKDINLYQSQKALENASRIAKKGGTIILIAELRDGFGEDIFEDWLLNTNSLDKIIEHIRAEFVLGGHKAAAIARIMKECKVILLSNLDESIAKRAFFKPIKDLQKLPLTSYEMVYIIPDGGHTMPDLSPVV